MIKQQNAVGYVFLQAVAAEHAVAKFGRDHRGDACILQPMEEPAQLCADNTLIAQAEKEKFDRIQQHTLGFDLVDGCPPADTQSLQVVLSGFFDLPALDVNIV